MSWRRSILGLLLLAAVATTGCGWRRNSAYRYPCASAPPAVLLPATAVPITTAGSNPCCCP